ncbi:endonuclease [bacterium]|nr:endonuclease [bacterium]
MVPCGPSLGPTPSEDRVQEYRATTALVALILALTTGWPTTVHADADTTDHATGPVLRVMSFNLRYGTAADGDHAWPQRRDLVRETIAAFDPDLLGTQECLAFQRDELADWLEGYAVEAAGRDDGREAGEMCASFHRTDRLERLDGGTFWLSETPDVVASQSWDAALPRIATWLRLRERASGTEILWINAHLDHAGPRSRRESARLLHRWLAANAAGAMLVVTGDFNAPASDDADAVHRILRGDPETPLLVDTWEVAPAGSGEQPGAADQPAGTFHGFTGTPRPARIDWVLATPSAAVLAAAIDRTGDGERWPSDHFPVTAVLRLP